MVQKLQYPATFACFYFILYVPGYESHVYNISKLHKSDGIININRGNNIGIQQIQNKGINIKQYFLTGFLDSVNFSGILFTEHKLSNMSFKNMELYIYNCLTVGSIN